MSKVLVIGGNGFIGSHLVDALLEQAAEVTVLDVAPRRYGPMPPQVRYIQGDLNQAYLLRDILTGVEVVYNLAWASIHETSNQNLAADIQANLTPAVQLLENAAWAGVRRVVFTSSGGTVYGPPQTLPMAENHPKKPNSSYGILKLTVEKYLQMFHHLHGLEYMILRPSVPYGPRQNPLGRQGAVNVFLYHIWRGLPLTLYGDGATTRDFFYISDLVSALLACSAAPMPADPIFNIGGSEEISLRQLIDAIQTVTGQQAQINYQPARSFDAQRVLLDTQHAQQVLSWSPQVPLAQGLQHTWQWMNSNL